MNIVSFLRRACYLLTALLVVAGCVALFRAAECDATSQVDRAAVHQCAETMGHHAFEHSEIARLSNNASPCLPRHSCCIQHPQICAGLSFAFESHEGWKTFLSPVYPVVSAEPDGIFRPPIFPAGFFYFS